MKPYWKSEDGQISVYCAPRAIDVLRSLAPQFFDVIATDPPYATTGESTSWVTKGGARTLPREVQFYEAWMREHLVEFARLMKPTGGVWMSCDWGAALAIDQACARLGMRAPAIGVWDREGLGMGHVLRHVYECFAVITMPEWERIATDEPDVWRCKWTPGDRTMGHSAEKPESLMVRAIRLLAKTGTVLDPFMGSGTTMVAAARMGFGFVGIEREREHCDTAIARLGAITPERAAAPPGPLFASRERAA